MSRPDDLAVVACHFNPCGYKSRERNLLAFLRRMNARGIPVFVAELVFPGGSPLLHERDGSVTAWHFAGTGVMWQKERLLNLAIERLPDRFTKVAWIDADVLFPDPLWYDRASALLESCAIAQLFERAYQLNEGGRGIKQISGVAGYVAAGKAEPFSFLQAKPGLAWAATRSLLAAHGLLDFMILGGADTYMTLAAFRVPEAVAQVHFDNLPPRLVRAIADWSAPFGADVRAGVGYLPGAVIQLNHGMLAHRRYYERMEILSRGDFDPATDIEREANGVWRWAPGKDELRAEVAEYFVQRREDAPFELAEK